MLDYYSLAFNGYALPADKWRRLLQHVARSVPGRNVIRQLERYSLTARGYSRTHAATTSQKPVQHLHDHGVRIGSFRDVKAQPLQRAEVEDLVYCR